MLRNITAIIVAFLVINVANASVILNNPRIVIDNAKMEKNVQFTNSGDNPVLVQIQAQENGENDCPPFIALPAVFRMLPGAGQTVKVSLTKRDIPKDRESLFYMDYIEVPSVKKDDQNRNKLYLIIRSRVKVIFRPEGLVFSVNKLHKQLSYEQFGNIVTIKNNSPFYANIRSFYLTGKTGNINYPGSVTVPPYGESRVQVKKVGETYAGLKMTALIINDFGADEKVDIAKK
ncbi:molecular chaperone [Escherichia coli]|nr:molecular chaperone [Escherichia coli]